MTIATDYDITIIGAGIVGLTFACALAPSGLRIAIVDQQLPAEFIPHKQFDVRVSAITLGSRQLFEQLDVWSAIQAQRVSAFYKMEVWDAIGSGNIEFDSHDIGQTELGYIIENKIIQAALFAKLKTYANITIIGSVGLQQFTEQELLLTDERKITSQLIVGADGAHSKVRQLAEIKLKTHNYGQTALVCNVRTSVPHEKIARQRFLATGPLAFLPLADPHWCSIVWSTTPAEAEFLMKADELVFKNKLAESLAYRLGKIEEISTRAIFPLQMQHVSHYVKPQLALIGDAAHTLHPLAGQGVNLGLLDAQCLAEVILTAHAKKRSIGSLATLRRYERSRKGDNLAMIAFVELIKRLFSTDNKTVRTIASFGLDMTNRLSWLKNFFIKRAVNIS